MSVSGLKVQSAGALIEQVFTKKKTPYFSDVLCARHEHNGHHGNEAH